MIFFRRRDSRAALRFCSSRTSLALDMGARFMGFKSESAVESVVKTDAAQSLASAIISASMSLLSLFISSEGAVISASGFLLRNGCNPTGTDM